MHVVSRDSIIVSERGQQLDKLPSTNNYQAGGSVLSSLQNVLLCRFDGLLITRWDSCCPSCPSVVKDAD